MPDTIRDGTGTGSLAQVTDERRLSVTSKNEPLQHSISVEYQQAYQCLGFTTLANGTVTAIHLKNTSSTENMIVTYIRHQIIDPAGGTAFPNSSNYYSMRLGRIYSSGGTVAIPVNLFAGTGNIAGVIAYQESPVLSGSALEIDRQYTKAAGDMNSFNKEGSLIIPPNQTMEISYVGDQTSGTIYTRVSFLMEKRGSHGTAN